eukprot:9188036-Prorocentrum_lima.AAC.1
MGLCRKYRAPDLPPGMVDYEGGEYGTRTQGVLALTQSWLTFSIQDQAIPKLCSATLSETMLSGSANG